MRCWAEYNVLFFLSTSFKSIERARNMETGIRPFFGDRQQATAYTTNNFGNALWTGKQQMISYMYFFFCCLSAATKTTVEEENKKKME